MLDSETARELIKLHMPVVCLTKDDDGEHHYVPLSWVTSVDDKVHIDRPGKQAKREWSTTLPKQ